MAQPEAERRILELFSGIGGMHSAFTRNYFAALDENFITFVCFERHKAK